MEIVHSRWKSSASSPSAIEFSSHSKFSPNLFFFFPFFSFFLFLGGGNSLLSCISYISWRRERFGLCTLYHGKIEEWGEAEDQLFDLPHAD